MDEPLWYKNAIFYQVYVRAFKDSNGDGHGDLQGLTLKLDYLKELGIDCVWLMPIYPSPLKDDGYDIADYCNIAGAFGTLDDFKGLLAAAHSRGIRLIMDLVMNHTSDEHPWFQAARSDRKSPYRDYYVWSDTAEKYKRRPHHLRRHRTFQLDLGRNGGSVLLAPFLRQPTRSELR